MPTCIIRRAPIESRPMKRLPRYFWMYVYLYNIQKRITYCNQSDLRMETSGRSSANAEIVGPFWIWTRLVLIWSMEGSKYIQKRITRVLKFTIRSSSSQKLALLPCILCLASLIRCLASLLASPNRSLASLNRGLMPDGILGSWGSRLAMRS